MLSSMKRIHIEHVGIVVFGAAILACPNLASSSCLVPPLFGLTHVIQMAAVVFVAFLSRFLPPAFSDERHARYRWGFLSVLVVGLLVLEGFCAAQRSNDVWIRSYHGSLSFLEQTLLVVAMVAWVLCARYYGRAGEWERDERGRSKTVFLMASGLALGFLLMICLKCAPVFWSTTHDGAYLLIVFIIALGLESLLVSAVLMCGMWALLASFCGRIVWLALLRVVPSGLGASLAPSFVLACLALAVGAIVGLYINIVRLAKRQDVRLPQVHDEKAGSPYSAALERLEGYERLSAREIDAVRLALEGLTQKQTAQLLGISAPTAGTYRTRAYRKLGVSSKEALVDFIESSRNGEQHVEMQSEAASNDGVPQGVLDIDAKRAFVLAFALALAYGAAVALSILLPGAARVLIAQFAGSSGLLLALYVLTEACEYSMQSRLRVGRAACMMLVSLAWLSTPYCTSPHVVFDMNQAKVAGEVALALGTCTAGTLILIDMWLVEHSLRLDMGRYCIDEERAHHFLVSRGVEPFVAEVLIGIARGVSTRSLAKRYCMSPATIAMYRSHGYKVLGVSGKEGLRAYLACAVEQ